MEDVSGNPIGPGIKRRSRKCPRCGGEVIAKPRLWGYTGEMFACVGCNYQETEEGKEIIIEK